MERVITYIDGFNLYFGMKDKFQSKYLWLNLEELSRSLLKNNQTLISTKYFTSRVTNQPNKEKRQNIYLEALESSTECKFYFGRYQSNVINCKQCGSNWPSPKEKMTDVNIATQLIIDAFTNQFDTAILISGDSDLFPPIQNLKSHLPQKRIGIFFPPNRHSIHLKSIANFSGFIGKKTLKLNQLPTNIQKINGTNLSKPLKWS